MCCEVLRLSLDKITVNRLLRFIYILQELFFLFLIRVRNSHSVFERWIDHTVKRTRRFLVLLIHVDVVFCDIVNYIHLFFLVVLWFPCNVFFFEE